MSTATVIFNQVTTDTPQPTTVQGQPGWWTLPRHWTCIAFEGGANQLIATDPDSGKDFCCVLDDSGIQYAFQDLLRNKKAGII